MTTTFEVIALVVSPTVVAAYAALQRRWELTRADLGEARRIIDAAASQICKERDAVHELLHLWRIADRAGLDAATDKLNAVRVDSRALRTSLAVRLGPQSATVKRYIDILDEIDMFVPLVQEAIAEGAPYDRAMDRKHNGFITEHVECFETAAWSIAKVRAPQGDRDDGPSLMERITQTD
jgi:hypothetical protein